MGVGNSGARHPETGPAADSLLVGSDDRGWFISARGSVRASLCYPLRETLLARLDEPSAVPAVFVDLSRCSYMDSTFIGLLVAIDRKLQTGSGARLHVQRPSAECLELFRQLGLQDFLLIDGAPTRAPPELKELDATESRPGAEFVLRAHEALMETSEQARRKFGLLREELERKLRGGKPPGDDR
jgi:anti-anti-sigma regulatory factor